MTSEAEQEKRAKLTGLYEEYYDKIARYAYSRIGSRNDAEDIAGEVFLKALDSLKNYREKGIPMQAWLFKIAHNMVVDHLRRVSKIKSVSLDKIELAGDADPAAAAEMSIEMEKVTGAMEKLTANQREVLNLRFYGGLTSREVGSVMQKSDGAVREMQRAALEKLRQVLE
jgi:RNA polymerase sigma-70 factor (ECF subfamily)